MLNGLDPIVETDCTAHIQMCHGILDYHLSDNSRLEYYRQIVEAFSTDRSRIILNVSPDCANTAIFMICLITWLLAHDPGLRILLATHHIELSCDILSSIKQIVSSKKFGELYATRIDTKRGSAERLFIEGGGRVCAQSMLDNLGGHAFDVIAINDPLSIGDASKINRVNKINDIFDRTISPRLANLAKSRVIVSMHRLHDEDLITHLVQDHHYRDVFFP